MNSWDRFDRKIVLTFTGNKDRVDPLRIELSRVGINDVEFIWNVDTPYRRILHAVLKHIPNSEKFQFFNNMIQHYEAIKSSLELGCNHILLMEDDIRFLKDVEFIHLCINELPEDYDIAHLDHVRFNKWKSDHVTEHWKQWDSVGSAACYALNRNAMLRLQQMYEWMVSKGARFYRSDTVFKRNILQLPEPVPCVNLYGVTPNIARQVQVGHLPTNSNYDRWSKYYESHGAQKEKYAQI